MNILIVGGTGLIGGEIALYLQGKHDITIMSRKPPEIEILQPFKHLAANYAEDTISQTTLADFDCVVFAAAADIRMMPKDGSITDSDYFTKMNTEAVPAFFRQLKSAGVPRAIYIGSFYPQVAPEQITQSAYVASRHYADEGVRALNDDIFTVISVNAPFVLGKFPGLNMPYIDAMAAYAKGLTAMPLFAPQGGSNHITAKSIAQAIESLLTAGEPGKAYLIGDENYSWKAYLELWFELAGNPQDLPIKDQEHPLFPNEIMYAGVGATVSYEPENMDVLRYDRHQIRQQIADILAMSE